MNMADRKQNKRCPVCGAPEAEAYAPFCAKRCADVDLGRWLGGTYRIPGEPAEPEDMAAALRDGSAEGEGAEGSDND